MSHVRICADAKKIHTARIPAGEADLLLGCDLVVAASKEALGKLDSQRSRAVLDTYEEMTSGFLQNRDFQLPGCDLRDTVREHASAGQTHELDATGLATRLLGDSIGANLLLLGFAWQRGLVPLEESSILKAIELNGVAVPENYRAFSWGRRAACDPDGLRALLEGESGRPEPARDLETIISRRADFLRDYQDDAYAERYERAVRAIERVEGEHGSDPAKPLAVAVARNYFKLLAYKDEYEVARLYASTPFLAELKEQMEGDYRIQLHLSPPLLARMDPNTGRPRKIAFGSWMVSVMKILARLKFLRGSRLDPFAYGKERRAERQLVKDYEATLDAIAQRINSTNHSLAIELASWPDEVRGFGPVKAAAMVQAANHREVLLEQF
jgi:indolepyruvate ferredoxin oxidoreductase